MELKIDEVFVGERFRKELGDIQGLANNMKEVGQLQPIVVSNERKLIAGYRRLEAAKLLGWHFVEGVVAPNLKEAVDLVKAERSENIFRADFLASEAYTIGAELEKLEKEQADKRKKAGQPYGNFPQGSKGATRDLVGTAIGVSGRNYEKIKAICESGDPELIETMDKKSVDASFKQLLAKQQLEQRKAAIGASSAPMANVLLGDARTLVNAIQGPCRLILTDPPYGIGFVSGRRKETANELPIANDDEGAVELFASVLRGLEPCLAPDCHLLSFTGWQTEHAFSEAIRGLGWQIRGSLIWVKQNHGLGDLRCQFAPQHERLIHATRGDPDITPRISNVLYGNDLLPNHPTAKPISLLSELIRVTTTEGELVIDPFAGVGSTGVAAKKMGRSFWLCEQDAYYHSQILKNLEGGV